MGLREIAIKAHRINFKLYNILNDCCLLTG